MRYEIYSSEKMPSVTVTAIGCAEDPSDTHSGPIRRNAFVIHYCLSGRGYFMGNKVEGGQGFLFLPGSTVEYHPSKKDPWKYMWIIIDTDNPDFFLKFYNADEKTGIFTYDFPDVLEEQWVEIENNRVASVNPVEPLSVFFNILKLHTSEKKRGGKAWLYAMSAKKYIETNYHSRPSIGELAKHLNISQSYLYRVFIEEFGVSPKEYLNRFCIDQAKQLLRSSDMNISQIAASVGYNDVLAFSAFFSKRQGMPPSMYREKVGKGE